MRMLTIFGVVLVAFQASPLTAAEVVPHEAEYRLDLLGYHGPGSVESFEGVSRFHQSRDCQKWKVESETKYSFYVAGQYNEMSVYMRHLEALDGSRVEYKFQLKVNGDIKDEQMGSAGLQGPGKPGTVKYRKPRSDTGEIPAGTIFMLAARSADMGNLAAGKKRWTRSVFSFGEMLSISTSVVRREAAAPGKPAGDTDLVSGTSWMVKTKTQVSSGVVQETEEIIHGTGVVSRSVVNDGTIVTRSDLIKVKRLPAPQC